jgi:membrane protein implicated in regulation of membrane protease activity
MSGYRQTEAMKHLKRIAVFLLVGFLTFAPPGTLIFGAILILGLIGNVWLSVGGFFSLVALAAILLIRRRFAKRPNS